MKLTTRSFVIAGSALLSTLALASSANACGGFFCNSSQPVNQAAERIIFAENGDGTVTAVIQIQYQGPSESFSWLLPVPEAPKDLKLASDQAFSTLQSLTNPNYTLTTRVEGTCLNSTTPTSAGGGVSVGAAMASPPAAGNSPTVTQIASGSVGPFDWTVIAVAQDAKDPAGDAVEWLTSNKYDVPKSAPALIAPYLMDGMYLFALRLTKGQDAGSIRPIVLTYKADAAMIPVKLTSVAANPDMGVMTWLLGDGRGVPRNYKSLDLNEARINWFNANSNYNSVVTAAADDAGGQGFVTEFAGSTASFKNRIWSQESTWTAFKNQSFPTLKSLFASAQSYWGAYDGFWDGVKSALTISASLTFEDFKACPDCYIDNGVSFTPTKLYAGLEESVIEPMRIVQTLIDAHPSMTRLYTTLSAEEMTVDPLFTFNMDLPDVSNIHTATRVIECDGLKSQFEAPWRIELPQGGIIRGVSQPGTWPTQLDKMPPNRVVTQLSATGDGKELEDNSDVIAAALEDYNLLVAPEKPAAMPKPTASVSASTSATSKPAPSMSATGKTSPSTTSVATTMTPGTTGSAAASSSSQSVPMGTEPAASGSNDSGCSTAAGSSQRGGWWLALPLLAMLRRRRQLG